MIDGLDGTPDSEPVMALSGAGEDEDGEGGGGVSGVVARLSARRWLRVKYMIFNVGERLWRYGGTADFWLDDREEVREEVLNIRCSA